MILKVKDFLYTDSTHRERLASYLARLVSPNSDAKPYNPEPNNTDFWRIDHTANNWTLKFIRGDDPQKEYETFRLEYRYRFNYPEHEKALLVWLKTKMPKIELVEE